jgi:hypothetical protein
MVADHCYKLSATLPEAGIAATVMGVTSESHTVCLTGINWARIVELRARRASKGEIMLRYCVAKTLQIRDRNKSFG